MNRIKYIHPDTGVNQVVKVTQCKKIIDRGMYSVDDNGRRTWHTPYQTMPMADIAMLNRGYVRARP